MKHDSSSEMLDGVNLGQEQIQDGQQKCVPRQRPDRGWAWVVFLASCIIHFMVFGMHYSFGVLFPRLVNEFQEGEGKTAWVGSLSSGSLFFGSILAVKLADMTNVTITCMCGAILSGLGLILTATVDRFSLLYVTHSFLFGIGTSLMYTPSLIIIAKWFEKWRHFITGTVVAAGSFGQVVLSPTLQYCLDAFGLRSTFKLAGAVCAVSTALCSCAFYPMRKDLADNIPERKSLYKLNFRLLKDRAFLVWVLVMMITNFSYYIPLTFLVTYAERLGATRKQGSLLLTSMAISGILGRIFFGRVANYRTKWTTKMYQAAMFCSGTCTVIFSCASKFWHLLLYTVLYGFLDGSFIGLMSLVTLDIVQMEDMAQGWGLMLFAIAGPIALGPPTVGWINDSKNVYGHHMFFVAGFPIILGSLLMFLVHNWKKNRHEIHYNVNSNKNSIQFEPTPDRQFLLQVVSVL